MSMDDLWLSTAGGQKLPSPCYDTQDRHFPFLVSQQHLQLWQGFLSFANKLMIGLMTRPAGKLMATFFMFLSPIWKTVRLMKLTAAFSRRDVALRE